MTRGQLIRTERERRGLSQQQVADTAKISQQTYSDIEGDRIQSPRRPILKAIAKMLEIPFESLLLGDDYRGENIPESARVVAREYPSLSPDAKNKILMIMIEDKQRREAEEESSQSA